MRSKTYILAVLFLFLYLNARANSEFIQDLNGKIDIVVDAGGTGDYTTVQAAINAVPNNGSTRTVVFIKNGLYYEKVRISSSKKNLVLIGENVDSTIIYFDDYAAISGFDCTTVKVDADDFLAMNLTIENSFDNTPVQSQALALATYGDRQVFLHCKFLGFQDTYFSGSNKRAYFKDCLIVGAVDYIYGPTTILLDSCQIHNVRQQGGYITAASTPENNKYGYVFRNCWISGDIGVNNVDFGRPWRPYAKVVWLNCYESSCVSAKGWNNWGNAENEETAYYAEYNCFGPGSDISKRVDWSYQLSEGQAAEYTMANIFAASNNASVSTDWLPDVDSDELYSILKKYTIKYLAPVNVDSKLNSLKVDGVDLESFHPDSLVIPVELPTVTTEIPQMSATSGNEATSITITYPETIPGFGQIDVVTPYLASISSYKVYFSVKNSFHSANILGITMNGIVIPDFDLSVTDYDFEVPDGASRYMPIVIDLESKDAKLKRSRPASLPGEYTFRVTAVDGYTAKEYSVYVSYSTEVSLEIRENKISIENPMSDQINGYLEVLIPGEYEFELYSINGRLLKKQSMGFLEGRQSSFFIDSEALTSGSYIYRISGPATQFEGYLIK